MGVVLQTAPGDLTEGRAERIMKVEGEKSVQSKVSQRLWGSVLAARLGLIYSWDLCF